MPIGFQARNCFSMKENKKQTQLQSLKFIQMPYKIEFSFFYCLSEGNQNNHFQNKTVISIELIKMNREASSFQRAKKRNRKGKLSIDPDPHSNQIYEQFTNILSRRRQVFLKERLFEYYGKNFPINYREHYLFQEQWQNNKQNLKDRYIRQPTSLQNIILIITSLVYSFTIWLTNIDFYFKYQGKVNLYYETYTLACIFTIINLLIKAKRINLQFESGLKFKAMLSSQYQSIIIFIYLLLKIGGLNYNESVLWFLFQTFVLILIYHKASQIYESIRLMNFSLQYQYQTKVIDMIVTIFIIAHLIAICLYSITRLHPDNNWLTSLSIDKDNEFTLYIYSFYFCATTIMTVGYGDIIPKNSSEVTIIIFIQIFGIVMLGYIINQIGYCITSLRRDQEIVEKDLSIFEKLKKHYRMNEHLSQKVRSYLLNCKQKVQQLSPEEQNGILMKVNEQIRADMMKQNMYSIVKSSVFFLCRWSNHFQHIISTKLIHTIFNPNDVLYQPNGKERVYIIKSGMVDIHVGSTSVQKKLQNILKKITNSIEKEFSHNCYGYTAVISNRSVKLTAISKEFTSAYYIDKQNFISCIHQKPSDFEFYHEMKSRMSQVRLCESIQIPKLQSTKHHYNPTKNLIIRKMISKKQGKDVRNMTYKRNQQRVERKTKYIVDEEAIRQVKNVSRQYNSLDDQNLSGFSEEVISIQQVQVKKQRTRQQTYTSIVFERDFDRYFDHFFESGKEYNNYFIKNNRKNILHKLQNQYLLDIQHSEGEEEFSPNKR